MATRLDVVNNWIQTDLVIDMNHHEDSADYLVRMMNNYTTRTYLQMGHTVRVQHMEMSTAMFDAIEHMHKHFPAFRLRSFRSLRPRSVIGTLCGLSVYRNEKLDQCVRFQYREVRACNTESLVDPSYINHPKGASSPFIYN